MKNDCTQIKGGFAGHSNLRGAIFAPAQTNQTSASTRDCDKGMLNLSAGQLSFAFCRAPSRALLACWMLCILALHALAQWPLPDDFNPGVSGAVSSLAVQPDGKILAGGDFTTLGGQSRFRIGRLNADGTVDRGFNPGANSRVYSLAVQTDGKELCPSAHPISPGR
jgi:hypothetical protein